MSRPELFRYVPPNRRKNSISGNRVLPAQGASGGLVYVAPPATSRVAVLDSPGRFEPPETPPLRPEMSRHQSRTSTPRREVYEPAMSPGPGHRRVEIFREHGHRDPHHGALPAHVVRNRSYEDRYKEAAPAPSPFRKQQTPAGWMDGKASPAVMHAPIRILRNPERERERNRENFDEHVPRTFVLPPRPEEKPRPTRVATHGELGERIHSLTPLTSLEERCRKFISSLNPETPDPPEVDDPYDYPETHPNPTGRKAPSGGSGASTDDRPAWMSPAVKRPVDYLSIPDKVVENERRSRRPGRPQRHRRRDEYSSDEDCARRIYRLHT